MSRSHITLSPAVHRWLDRKVKQAMKQGMTLSAAIQCKGKWVSEAVERQIGEGK